MPSTVLDFHLFKVYFVVRLGDLLLHASSRGRRVQRISIQHILHLRQDPLPLSYQCSITLFVATHKRYMLRLGLAPTTFKNILFIFRGMFSGVCF